MSFGERAMVKKGAYVDRKTAAGTVSDEDVQALAEGYREMAADQEREAEAEEWCEQLIRDVE
jgi:hypothetical protein